MLSCTVSLILLAACAARVSAQATPTAPGPNDVFKEGTNCSFSWKPDNSSSSPWKSMSVQLFTGPNKQQVHLKDIATLDGTDPDLTTFSYPCPEVTPNAPIYFYVFNSVPPTAAAFTTRFTIAGPNDETVPAPNAKQPEGDPIPWGTGMLVGDDSNSTESTSTTTTTTTSSASSSSKDDTMTMVDTNTNTGTRGANTQTTSAANGNTTTSGTGTANSAQNTSAAPIQISLSHLTMILPVLSVLAL